MPAACSIPGPATKRPGGSIQTRVHVCSWLVPWEGEAGTADPVTYKCCGSGLHQQSESTEGCP